MEREFNGVVTRFLGGHQKDFPPGFLRWVQVTVKRLRFHGWLIGCPLGYMASNQFHAPDIHSFLAVDFG
jgi:hypothetical protein